MRKIILPKRPYKNFDDYIRQKQEKSYKYRSYKEIVYVCTMCNGSGRIVDQNCPFANDPIEGNKMATRITCPECNGSGISSKEISKAKYKVIIDRWKKQYTERKTEKDLQQNALKKLKKVLNKEEIEILGLY